MKAPVTITYANSLREEFVVIELSDGRTLLLSVHQILALRPRVIGATHTSNQNRLSERVEVPPLTIG